MMASNGEKNYNFVSKQQDLADYGTSDQPISDAESTTVFEGMTSISAILHGMERGVCNRTITCIYFDRERLNKKEKEYRYLQHQAQKYGFDLQLTDRAQLDSMTTGNTHGGIVALCTARALPSLQEAISTSLPPFSQKNGFFVLLEGIEDPYNFGYTMRSLYAAGVDGVILPPRNWMEVAGIVARSSAGASEQLPIAIAEPSDAVKWMRDQGYRVVCAGIRDSVSMYEANLSTPILLIVGGEKRGISSAVLSQADQIVRIDYGRAFQGSLSAASAATVLAFEVLRQNSKKE